MLPDPEGREPEVDDFEDVVDAPDDQDEGRDVAGADADDADAGDADDADREADAGDEDDAGADEGQGGQPPQVRGPGRRERAVIEAKRIAREAKAEAEATRAELNKLQQERQGRNQQEVMAERQARLELMSPDEKTNFLLNEQEQRFSGAFNQLRFEQADTRDQTRFEAVCARKPHFAAIADEVENELAKMRRGGATAPRETIALYLIGKKADERASKGGKAKQAAKGASRVQQNRVAAPSGRSDVSGGSQRRGGSEAVARRARLENQSI